MAGGIPARGVARDRPARRLSVSGTIPIGGRFWCRNRSGAAQGRSGGPHRVSPLARQGSLVGLPCGLLGRLRRFSKNLRGSGFRKGAASSPRSTARARTYRDSRTRARVSVGWNLSYLPAGQWDQAPSAIRATTRATWHALCAHTRPRSRATHAHPGAREEMRAGRSFVSALASVFLQARH